MQVFCESTSYRTARLFTKRKVTGLFWRSHLMSKSFNLSKLEMQQRVFTGGSRKALAPHIPTDWLSCVYRKVCYNWRLIYLQTSCHMFKEAVWGLLLRFRCKTIGYSNLLKRFGTEQFTHLERAIFFSFNFWQRFGCMFIRHCTAASQVKWVIHSARDSSWL